MVRAVAAGLEDAKALSFVCDERALARVDRETETALPARAALLGAARRAAGAGPAPTRGSGRLRRPTCGRPRRRHRRDAALPYAAPLRAHGGRRGASPAHAAAMEQ